MQSLHDKAQEAAFNDDVIRSGREILLQGFNWESHKHDWWDNLEKKAPDLAKFGFTSIWLPPTTQAVSPEGYLPQNLYSLNSCYGSEKQLKALLQKLCQHKIRSMADIVINHRVGTTQGQGGAYNCFDGIPMPWDEHAITSCSGGLMSDSEGEFSVVKELLVRVNHKVPSKTNLFKSLAKYEASLARASEVKGEYKKKKNAYLSVKISGNQSTGCKFSGVPNIDHTQPFVQKDIIKWLIWLQETVGFQDFRFDYAKGYDAKFVKMYVEQSKPIFSVGEYWDSCCYNSSNQLDYNQDSHRQRIINWIDRTGRSCAAFDFTTKGILQEAVKGELWRLKDPQGKPPGVLGWWPSRAVTFVENHDTGSTQGHWPFPSDHLMEGYAYILTHPGIPMVFYDHLYDWGKRIQGQIAALMKIRRQQDIHSRSPIRILESHSNLYAAIIGEKLCVKIGDRSWCPADGEWTVAASGTRYAVWCR